MNGSGELTLEFLYAQLRWIAFAVLFLCCAVLLDEQRLKRFEQRLDSQFTLFNTRTGNLASGLDDLGQAVHDRLSPTAAAGARARPARKAASAAAETDAAAKED